VILAIAFGGTIAFVNSDSIIVNIPTIGEYSLPLGLTFILSFAFGATTVVFYFWLDVFMKTLTIRKLKKELRNYQSHAPRQRETGLSKTEESNPITVI
jgi:uncharacterized integral membrane protein